MLAEKFILVLEAIRRSNQYPDGSERVRSTAAHIPIAIPDKKTAASAHFGAGEADPVD